MTQIDESTKEKLKRAGFNSLKDLAIRRHIDISNSARIKLEDARHICNMATIKLEESGVIPKSFAYADVLKRHREYISTGSKNLDVLFGGRGIETQVITQFYGAAGSGKTQICYILSVMLQKQNPVYKAIYIDTEGKFRPERISEIAAAKGLDPEKVLHNIIQASPLNSARQESIIQECITRLEDDANIKLLIVDSITNHYRSEYSGRGMLPQRQHSLNKLMHFLQILAQTCRVSVIITNQVQTLPQGELFTTAVDMCKPVGGNVLAHASTYVVYLRSNNACSIQAKLVKGPCLTDTRFMIGDSGIIDEDN